MVSVVRSYITRGAKSEQLIFSAACRERINKTLKRVKKKLLGWPFFKFSGVVDAPGTQL